MRFAAAVVVGSILASPAFASGGLHCRADGEKASFEITAGVTRGMGSPVFSMHGELEIFEDSVADDLKKTMFERDNLAQYWLSGDELNLVLYRERTDGPFGSIELTVQTTARGEDDEGFFDGDYDLQVSEAIGEGSGGSKIIDVAGKVECSAE